MSTSEEIRELITTSGQSSSDMTQALKAIGGDMKSGLKAIGEFFFEEGMSKGYQSGVSVGEKNGVLKGSAITFSVVALIQGGIYLYGKHKDKKHQKAQEEALQKKAETIKAAIASQNGENTDLQATTAEDAEEEME